MCRLERRQNLKVNATCLGGAGRAQRAPPGYGRGCPPHDAAQDDLFRISNFLGLFIQFSKSVGDPAGDLGPNGKPKPMVARSLEG